MRRSRSSPRNATPSPTSASSADGCSPRASIGPHIAALSTHRSWQTGGVVTREGVATTACPLDCPDMCTLDVRVEGGRIVSVDAGAGNPLTQDFICQKVKHHARRVYA